MGTNKLILWVLRVVPAVILLQTLYFKFKAHPESVILFSKLDAEPYGRIVVGIAELIAGFLLLIPATTRFGAVLSTGLMVGAIGAHLFVIGIVSNDDRGLLFIMALVVMLTSIANLWIYRADLRKDLKKFKPS